MPTNTDLYIERLPFMPHDHKHKRLLEKLERELGPQIIQLLAEEDVTNILLNDDGQLWYERLGRPMEHIGYMSPDQAQAAIKTMAAYQDRIATEDNPIVEGRLPLDGRSRFEGLLPPVVQQPIFAIRRHNSAALSFDDYVSALVMSEHTAALIKKHIRRLDNIIICGGTGSGKTTLLNTCLDYATTQFPSRRRVIIEDTPELKRTARNCLMLHAQSDNPKADGLALLKATMRLYPDSIDYGEVRDHAAHTLLKAWTTGHHGGFSTLHVSHGTDGILRLEQLLLESTPQPLPHLIASAVGLFINIQKTPDGLSRHITNMTRVDGYCDGRYLTHNLPL